MFLDFIWLVNNVSTLIEWIFLFDILFGSCSNWIVIPTDENPHPIRGDEYLPISKRFTNFLSGQLNSLFALQLSILSALYFLIIAYPEYFSFIPGFSQRVFASFILVFYLVYSLAVCYFQDWSRRKVFSVWAQVALVFLFAVAYFTRINNVPLNLLGLTFSTYLVFIPLTAFVFVLNRNFFGVNRTSTIFGLGQTMLVSLTVFSLLYFLRLDNTGQRSTNNDFLNEFFKLGAEAWLLLGAFAISLSSTLSLKIKAYYDSFAIFIFFFVTILQSEVVLNYLKINYWGKTLILAIIWDYLFNAVRNFLSNPHEKNYFSKLVISTLYHLGLVVLILLFNLNKI
jgi:hypothetical protein